MLCSSIHKFCFVLTKHYFFTTVFCLSLFLIWLCFYINVPKEQFLFGLGKRKVMNMKIGQYDNVNSGQKSLPGKPSLIPSRKCIYFATRLQFLPSCHLKWVTHQNTVRSLVIMHLTGSNYPIMRDTSWMVKISNWNK